VRVSEHDTLDGLIADMKQVPVKVAKDCRATVREAAKVGNQVAKDNAKRTAGKHGKLYPRAFTWEAGSSFHGFGASVYSAEYGPDIARPQGGMEFEHGSRNSPPHLDLAKSADLIGPSFAQEIRGKMDGWFW